MKMKLQKKQPTEVKRMSYAKLRGRIREMYGTDAAFSTVVGINKSTLSKKLNNKSDWSRSEMEAACKALDISLEDMVAYFFTPVVAKQQH